MPKKIALKQVSYLCALEAKGLVDHDSFQKYLKSLEENQTVASSSSLTIDYSLGLDTLFRKGGFKPVKPEARQDKIEIDPKNIGLILALKPNEEYVNGEENLRRLLARKDQFQLLDAYVLQALYRRPELIPASWKEVGAIYFWGTIFTSVTGDRCAPCLCWDCQEQGWRWYYNWLQNDAWHSRLPAATLVSSP